MTEKPSLAQRWDARYAEKGALWSGEINPRCPSTNLLPEIDRSVDAGGGPRSERW
ncbi:hypothetical protein [uncultured Corynebacterium sp.]|uniref:hypothetical protein n=1 Tax=uncultured Corynebacterium sp. TaxID=159447 RepID=UPI002596BC92|nr:hypothetical protein [uncultured Corynebacterium sp.]